MASRGWRPWSVDLRGSRPYKRLLAQVRSDKLVARGILQKPSGTSMKRSGALLIACSFGGALLALTIAGFFHLSAHAQSADLVLCDRLAADPTDPDKPNDVKGTPEIAPSDVAT